MEAKEYVEKRKTKRPNVAYYKKGKIECIDFIMDKELNFNRGNVIKYVVRAGFKDRSKEIEDLEKAVNYLNFEIEYLKSKQNEIMENTWIKDN